MRPQIGHKKDTCLQYESWNEKTVSPCSTSAGMCVSDYAHFFVISTCLQKTRTIPENIGLEVTDKFS